MSRLNYMLSIGLALVVGCMVGQVVDVDSSEAQEPKKIRKVSLVGHDGGLEWSRDDAGLHVVLPAKAPSDFAYALAIEFSE